MVGTLINVATVVAGSDAGLLVGRRLPERTRQTVLHGLGLMTMVIGMSMALQTQNPLRMLAALLLGGAIGEALGLEERLQRKGSSPRGSSHKRSIAWKTGSPDAPR